MRSAALGGGRERGLRRPQKSSRRVALGLALGLLCAVGAAGCGEPDVVVVRLSAADFTAASELDSLEVTVAAAGSADGTPVCRPHTETFELSADESGFVELPLSIRVRPGPRYDRILYVRVRGYLNDMLRLQMERMISLRGGTLELELELLEDCLGVGTGATRHCVNGAEVSSPYAAIFDDEKLWDPEPCVEP
jgi:hypothetical protein